MLYMKIGDVKYPAETQSFTSQFGNNAIRVISEDAPVAENGFLIVDENDKVITDRSDYIYLLRETEGYKDYTAVPEEVVPVECFSMGDVPINPVQRQINSLNSRVNAITPYVQSKEAFYGEIEKVFYGVPNGNVSVFFDNYSGEYEESLVEDRLTIKFPERLTDMTNITVMVQ